MECFCTRPLTLTRPESLEAHFLYRLRLDAHSDGTVSSSTSTSSGTSSRVLLPFGREHGAGFFLEFRRTGTRFPQARPLGLLEVPKSP